MSGDELLRARASIERQLERVQDSWGIRGWSFVGRSPRIRVQVHVDVMVKNPGVAASKLRLPPSIGGGELKVAIAATHAHLPARTAPEGDNGTLAPGSPIRAVSGSKGGRAGVAAFAVDEDEVVYLLTCGHAFPAGTGHVEVSGTRVANVVANALFSDRIDAALCRLTSAGLQLARKCADEPTWFERLHRPSPDDNDAEVTFYPTHGGHMQPFVERVESFSACDRVGGFDLCDLITLPECTLSGDSGSLLAFDGAFYALCTGTTGTLSCFTPIVTALRFFRQTKKGLRLWLPDD